MIRVIKFINSTLLIRMFLISQFANMEYETSNKLHFLYRFLRLSGAIFRRCFITMGYYRTCFFLFFSEI